MLKNLIIRNYALIENLDIDFEPGLTIITGETGAGKSIIMGALSLVMGGRADTKMISDGVEKSQVQALFIDIDPELRHIMQRRGIEWSENQDGISELSVRREILASGRSKVFINDCQVTLQTLAEIMPRLIDIHSQHANAKINDAVERLNIIDALADNKTLRDLYAEKFTEYVNIRRQINGLKSRLSKNRENLEFMKFRFDFLDKLKPKVGELRDIEKRFEILSDADEIKEKLNRLEFLIGDTESGAQSLISEATALADSVNLNLFESKNGYQEEDAKDESESDDTEILNRLKKVLVELKDIQETVSDYNSSIDTNPALLARLSERMKLYYNTMQRFSVAEAEELVAMYDDLKQKISDTGSESHKLPELEKEAVKIGTELRAIADRLTHSRIKSAPRFSEILCDTARPLGLNNIEFKAEVQNVKLSVTGKDQVDFLCSFNKNGTLRPVEAIASGGEISRLMLALKSILAGNLNLPTIIFDEIDTGVSGEIADKMGEMMHLMAADMQVIAITHLPQVAAKGNDHFKVYKTDVEHKTVTRIKKLDTDEKIRELAAMISGSEVTEVALLAARQLIS